MEYVYVLKLENERYYVGKTADLGKRFMQHMNGEGAKWTQLNKPISMVATYPCEHELEEEVRTLEWMDTKGIDNVRGAGYITLHLSDEERGFITKKINTMKNRCYICNKTGHFAPSCPQKQDKPEDELKMMSIEELRTRRRSKWLISELLPDNGLYCLYGSPGCGKTFLALDMGLHIAHGIPWHAQKARHGLVYYVVAEGVQGILDRIQSWHSFHEKTTENLPFYVMEMHQHDLHTRKYSDQLIQKVRRHSLQHGLKPRLIIIDTLAHALSRLNENSSTEVGMLLREMLYINSALQCGTLFIHHSNKSNHDMRGSSALLAAVDTSIYMSKTHRENASIYVAKQKDGQPVHLHAHIQPHHTSCVIASVETDQK